MRGALCINYVRILFQLGCSMGNRVQACAGRWTFQANPCVFNETGATVQPATVERGALTDECATVKGGLIEA